MAEGTWDCHDRWISVIWAGTSSTSYTGFELIFLCSPEPHKQGHVLPFPNTPSPLSVTHLATGMAVVAPHGEREVTAAVHAHHGMCDRHQGGEPLSEADPQPLPDLWQPATTVRRGHSWVSAGPFSLILRKVSCIPCSACHTARHAPGLNCGARL